ncbi:MAG: hypothetical protein ACE5FN_01430 [Leptospirillia bacterium]
MNTSTSHSASSTVPFLALMVTVAGILIGAAAHSLPSTAYLAPANQEKQILLSQLNTVNAVGHDPDALLLFSGRRPVMVIWTSSSPAELYTIRGDFVAELTDHEFRRIIAVTNDLMGDSPSLPQQGDDRLEIESNHA